MKGPLTEIGLKAVISALNRRVLEAADFLSASVLIPILASGGPLRIVLTVRTEEVEHHKNQISFPGGKRDDGEDAWSAALRETHEEVGIEPSAVRPLGALDDIYTISRFRVTPFVGWIDRPVRLVGNPREIAQILEVPIQDLLDPNIHREEKAEWSGQPITFHFYYWRSHVIWGATGMILGQFLALCGETVA